MSASCAVLYEMSRSAAFDVIRVKIETLLKEAKLHEG